MKFLPEGKTVRGKAGESILDVARSGGVDYLGPCAGTALCAKCTIRILAGGEALSPVSPDERAVLGAMEISDGYRLGCRCLLGAEGEVTAFTPEESRLGTYVLLSESRASSGNFDPAVSAALMPLSRLGALASGAKRNLSQEEGSLSFTAQALRSFSQIERSPDFDVVLVRRGQEVLDVKREGGIFGFAVDVGTTKMAGLLVNLEDGRTLSTVTDVNPQMIHGEDVISRLAFALQGGRDRLKEEVVGSINALLARACDGAGVRPEEVYEVVAVGNSAMHHLLLGYDTRTLAYYPYAPATTAPLDLSASELGLKANSAARLFTPPLVAGFVGADVVADVVATEMLDDGGPSILVDIGTNTEVVVNARGRLLTCSTASGPAFEGAHVAFGMRAASGAIDRVEISGDSKVRYSVIGGTKPRGVTGSAVVDAIAELFRSGLLDKSGRLLTADGSGLVRTGERGYREFVIADRSETLAGADLTLNQRDVREIQLAKAAIRAGLNILMGEAGVDPGEVQTLYIAGAFGFFLNPVSAEAIGLYPEIDVNRIRLVGNTAASGARTMLVSESTRAAARRMAERMEYVELARHPGFKGEFMKSIAIPYDRGAPTRGLATS